MARLAAPHSVVSIWGMNRTRSPERHHQRNHCRSGLQHQGDEPLAPEGEPGVEEHAGPQLHAGRLGGVGVGDRELHPVGGPPRSFWPSPSASSDLGWRGEVVADAGHLRLQRSVLRVGELVQLEPDLVAGLREGAVLLGQEGDHLQRRLTGMSLPRAWPAWTTSPGLDRAGPRRSRPRRPG